MKKMGNKFTRAVFRVARIKINKNIATAPMRTMMKMGWRS